METAIEYTLPFLLSFILLSAFVIRTIWVARKTGKNPNHLKNDDTAMGFLGKCYGLVTLIIGGFITLRIFLPALDMAVPALGFLADPVIFKIGALVAFFGVIWSITAQAQMAASWRIGIPEAHHSEDKPILVIHGLFNISRNPFFLGSQIFYTGLFLMVPNAVTLTGLVALVITVNVQVRLEEVFLSQSLGAEYLAFKARVRRWI